MAGFWEQMAGGRVALAFSTRPQYPPAGCHLLCPGAGGRCCACRPLLSGRRGSRARRGQWRDPRRLQASCALGAGSERTLSRGDRLQEVGAGGCQPRLEEAPLCGPELQWGGSLRLPEGELAPQAEPGCLGQAEGGSWLVGRWGRRCPGEGGGGRGRRPCRGQAPCSCSRVGCASPPLLSGCWLCGQLVAVSRREGWAGGLGPARPAEGRTKGSRGSESTSMGKENSEK